MKKIKKLIACLLCIASLLTFGSAATFAKQLPYPSMTYSVHSNTNNVIPFFYGHYTKTITRYYSFSNIPQTYYYEEYNSNFEGWFSGTLTLQSATLVGDDWYKGHTYTART